MFSSFRSRRVSAFRRNNLPLSFTHLEDRTVPSAVISVRPADQDLIRSVVHDGATGSVKLPGREEGSRLLSTDFYLGINEQVLLSRRNDQVSVTLLGGRAELDQRLGQPNGPLMGYTVVSTMTDLKTFILQSPATNAADTLRRLAGTLNGGHAGPVFTPPGSVDWAVSTNEIIVRFGSDVDPNSYFSGADFVSFSEMTGMARTYLVKLAGDDATQALARANSLIIDDQVEWATPNFFQSRRLLFDPNDPLFPAQYHLKNTGAVQNPLYLAGADIGVTDAWNKTSGAGMKIAIVDTGVQMTHPDLSIDVANAKDFTGGSGPSGLDSIDFHGVATSGLAAAKGDNTLGVTGVAYSAQIVISRIFGDTGGATTDANIGLALVHAYQNADVVSNSWGGGAISAAIDQALLDAGTLGRGGKGTPIFFAAGNGGIVQYPATRSLDDSNVITVGGSTPRDTWSGYSSGPGMTISAPTDDFGGGGSATGIITTDRTDVNGYNTATSAAGGDYSDPFNNATHFGGTSSSSPIAAGVAALVLSQNNNLTAAQLRGYLVNTTDVIEGLGGIYDAKTNHSDFNGGGRVDAGNAIAGIGTQEVDVVLIGQQVVSGTTTVTFDGAIYPGGDPLDGTFHVRNMGDQTLNLSNLKISGGTEFTIQTGFTDNGTGKATSQLKVGESAYFTVRFTPTGGAPVAAKATFDSNDSDEGTYTINLSGDAVVRSVSGTIFRDADNSGSYNPAVDTPLANELAYIDVNNNGTLDISGPTNSGSGAVGNVPDADPNGIAFALTTAGYTGQLLDVNVNLDIAMTWDADLVAFLVAPTGQFINLFQQIGGSGDNFFGTILDDSAAVSINAGTAPFTGSFRPNEPLAAFQGLTGTDLNGTWNLVMFDVAGGDSATLQNWSLDITTTTDIPASSDAKGEYSFFDLAAGSYNIRSDVPAGFFQTTPAGGKYAVTITTPDDAFGGRDFGRLEKNSISGRVFEDHNGNGTIDAGDAGLANQVVFLDTNDNGILDATGGPVTLNSVDTPQAIADGPGPNDTNGVPSISVINVASWSGALLDVNVNLTITHTWDSDVVVELESPGGIAKVLLIDDLGGSGDNYVNTTLDDEGTTAITGGVAPFTGTFKPLNPLSAFDTLTPSEVTGDWKLYVYDDEHYDTGTLQNWALTLSAPVVGEASTKTDAAGDYIFLGAAPGTYNIRTVVPAGWNILNPAGPPVGKHTGTLVLDGAVAAKNFGEGRQNAVYGNTYLDVDQSKSLNVGDTPLAGVTVYDDLNNNSKIDVPDVVASTDVPKPIIDVGTNQSTLTVSGYVPAVTDVNVKVNLTHTWDSDLNLSLQGPTGVVIDLTSGNGGSGDNYTNTVFDDEAALSITTGASPFTGSFQPEVPLSSFDGLDPNGTWTLIFTDTVGGDAGTVLGWEITFNNAANNEAFTTSDAFGNYVLTGLAAGSHNIRRVTPGGLTNLEPTGDVHTVTLAAGGTELNRNFGHTDKTTATPAKVSNVKIDDGTSQHSRIRTLTVTFDQAVELPGNPADAFSLSRQGGGVVTLAGVVGGGGTVVTLTFSGAETDFTSLKDGRYDFSILATKVTTGGGTVQLDGDGNGTGGDNYVLNSATAPAAPTNIWRLFGDTDGDNDVDTSDYGAMRAVYGTTGLTPAQTIFDFDNDDDVDTNDIGALRSRFGASI